MARTIWGKIARSLGSILAMIGLLAFGIIFIIAPGLVMHLGCFFIRALE